MLASIMFAAPSGQAQQLPFRLCVHNQETDMKAFDCSCFHLSYAFSHQQLDISYPCPCTHRFKTSILAKLTKVSLVALHDLCWLLQAVWRLWRRVWRLWLQGRCLLQPLRHPLVLGPLVLQAASVSPAAGSPPRLLGSHLLLCVWRW